jgi:predicted nucleic acid-binding protein
LKEESEGILADTSVWIEFFKPRSEIGNKLESLLKKPSIWICGIVLFELVQGVKSAAEKATILETMSGLPFAEMSKSLWQKAGELSSSVKRKGLNLPLSDILVAALAIEYNLKIFTLDKHFEKIPEVRIYRI